MARLRLTAWGVLVGGLLCLSGGPLAQPVAGEAVWTTYHRDAGRSGDDPDGVNPVAPTNTWQSPDLGAPIWSQPLVLGSRVYVATVGNMIYALDGSSGAIIWKKNAGTPVPAGQLACGDILPTVGIVGTPVIDTATNVLYAVADTWEPGTSEAHHVLTGYSLTNGEQVLSTTVDPPGADPKGLLQRAALNLDQGNVVVGFGGNQGDCGSYRGTVVAAPESSQGTPSYWQVPIAPPSDGGGGVWAPAGPSVDGEGHIYAATGNPNPRPGKTAETYDYSDSVVVLDTALNRIGNFKPPSWMADSNNDSDLGSAGPELLPGGLLFQAGKNGTGYLIDRAAMGSAAAAVYSHQVCGGHRSLGGDAYSMGVIYIPCTTGVQALAYDQVSRTFTPRWQGPADAVGPPIVSAGSVWAVATGGFKGGGTKLYGLDPSTGVARYTETLPSPVADHFASPSAGGGRIFVATGSSVTSYQIAQAPTGEPPMEPTRLPQGPLGQPSITLAAGGSPPPSATLVNTSLAVDSFGRVITRIRCSRIVRRCIGSITLRTIPHVTHAGAATRTTAAWVLVTGRFAIPRGHVRTVVLHLMPRARKLLSRARVLKARAAIQTQEPLGRRRTTHTIVRLHLTAHHRQRSG
jgi:outer membrane protein assembly factor BamB